jgi:hypothetical protein
MSLDGASACADVTPAAVAASPYAGSCQEVQAPADDGALELQPTFDEQPDAPLAILNRP